jgi:Domain of unknown function (DUF4116)
MVKTRPRLERILALYGCALRDAVGQREFIPSMEMQPAKDLVLRFADMDPTDGKARTQWLVKTYIQDDQFKLEDLGRAHAALSAFERFKPKFSIKQRELSLLKSLRDLETLVDPFVGAEAKARLERDLSTATGRELRRLEELKARDESIIVQEEDGLPTIAVPMTEFASKWWGRGTKWCTAAEKDNAFAQYYKDGPLIIIVCSDGEKFQMHVTNNNFQFMDNTNHTVSQTIVLMRWNEFQSLLYWAIELNGYALQYVPEKHRTPELCRIAVVQNGLALYFVPHDLKSPASLEVRSPTSQRLDSKCALEVRSSCGEDQRTPELCRLAVQQRGEALFHVPERHRTPELCRLAIEQSGWALKFLSLDKRSLELCRIAVEQEGWALQFVPEEYLNSEFYRLAVEQNGEALRDIPTKLKTTKLCRLAVEQDGRALRYIPEEHRTPELCCLAVERNGEALQYVSTKLKTTELCCLAVEQNGKALYYVPNDQRTPELCRIAIERNGDALQFIPEYYRTLELCCLAVAQNINALHYVPDKHRTPELLALIPPMQPKWGVDILEKLCCHLDA